MIWETIFFASGSVFFLLSIFILAMVGFYLYRIVSSALSLERSVKDLADEIKSKVTVFSITFAGMLTLLEKLIQYKKGSSQKEDDEEEKQEEEAKRGPKKIKIAKLDQE